MSLWPRIVKALEAGPGTASEIAAELGADSRYIGVNLREMYVAGYLSRERHHPLTELRTERRMRRDGYERTEHCRRGGRVLWRYALLD